MPGNAENGEMGGQGLCREARDTFMSGMSRIAEFWGFPRAMGAIYAAIYLSPEPLGLDALVLEAGVSKGAVSTHVRSLERLSMIHKRVIKGDRKDYYEAETDLWLVVRSILREREKQEFDRALATVGERLELVGQAKDDAGAEQEAAFLQERLQAMQSFFHSLDKLVATLITLDDIRGSVLSRFFSR